MTSDGPEPLILNIRSPNLLMQHFIGILADRHSSNGIHETFDSIQMLSGFSNIPIRIKFKSVRRDLSGGKQPKMSAEVYLSSLTPTMRF